MRAKRLSRRTFLAGAGLALGALPTAGCVYSWAKRETVIETPLGATADVR